MVVSFRRIVFKDIIMLELGLAANLVQWLTGNCSILGVFSGTIHYVTSRLRNWLVKGNVLLRHCSSELFCDQSNVCVLTSHKLNNSVISVIS